MRRQRGKDNDPLPGFPLVTRAPTDDTPARQRAFRTYVEPEIEVLLRVAQSLTGSWADSEDLVQDTLVRAYRAIGTFDGAYPRAVAADDPASSTPELSPPPAPRPQI